MGDFSALGPTENVFNKLYLNIIFFIFMNGFISGQVKLNLNVFDLLIVK